MRLKHLTLRGFKSFADRTRLDFSTGVNVVVGPNGSGKSNILDAIAWVMGTQATKALRTEKMEDVVFAGTATRPALSRAEVNLTFENDEELMPLNLAEITVTRRLFADGTSEYELNGAPCRLLDIQELLSDGGIGRHQHVLVGQGEVGQILNARPEDHRAVIEEAAGVTKHRSRRERAVRRLERTDHDMERLNDILLQQRKALRPLKRQANAAARHDAVRDEAHAIRIFLGGEELRRIRSRLGAASLEREAAMTARDEADAALGALKGRLIELRAQAGEVGAALERDTGAAARLETVKERLTRIAQVARERRSSQQARIDGADDRRVDLEDERESLIAAIAAAQSESVELADIVERRDVALKGLEDEERALAEQVQLPAEGVVANLRGDLRSLEMAAARDDEEVTRIRSRLSVIDSRIEEEEAERERLNAAIETADAKAGTVQAAYEKAAQVLSEAEERLAAVSADLAIARVGLAGARARAEALENAVAGLVDPAAIEAAEASEGVLGTIVSALDVPGELAVAVDVVLGGWRHAYVAADDTALLDAATRVKATGGGGVAFVTVSSADTKAAQAAATAFGVDTLIDMLGPDADRSVATSVVGDVVVAEGWQTAHRIVAAHPEVRVVTPEGDVVTASGMIVAQPDGAGPAAIEAASVAVEVADREVHRLVSAEAGARRSADAASEQHRIALADLESIEAELSGYTEALGLVERASAASVNERERLLARISAIEEAAVSRNERLSQVRARVEDFEGEEAARQAAWDALNERRRDVAVKRDEARKALEQAAADRASIVERHRLSEQRLEVVNAELSQLTLLPQNAESIDELESIEARAIAAIATVTAHVEELRARQRMHREQAGSANSELSEAEARRERYDTELRASGAALSALDVELAELRVRLESVAEALRRDADTDEATALAAERPEVESGIELEDRLASLDADLKRMGPINPLAAEEYATLAEEVETLETQLADLSSSRSELKGVIRALDDKMADLFDEAFADIARFYEENFALVFPGGKGSLRLTDPSDRQSTGVLVEAQPAGKAVGRLSLLSGGERSLAALAFLFAVFRARPSPFYVLDEVEAALDDTNLHRFLRLVDSLRQNTQLVIITHQQQTMGAADVLYGVTMEPGESSKVLSKRMSTARV